MAVIGFSDKPEKIWCVAGWAFRQILDHVVAQYPANLEFAQEFEKSKTYSGLSIDLLAPELASRITRAIRSVAAGILAGDIRAGIHDQRYGDAATVEQYREALRQLLEVVPANSTPA